MWESWRPDVHLGSRENRMQGGGWHISWFLLGSCWVPLVASCSHFRVYGGCDGLSVLHSFLTAPSSLSQRMAFLCLFE